jgi:hypothetical protein
MPVYVLPFHATAQSIELWVAWIGRRSEPTVVVVDSGGEEVARRQTPGLAAVGGGPNTVFFAVVAVDGLSAGTGYRARLLRPNGRKDLASCLFDTLPSRLPRLPNPYDPGEWDRPFVVALGSCFWYADDGGRQAERIARDFERVHDQDDLRPHVKFLVGDQVYLDQPPSEFLVPKSTAELTTFLTNRVAQTWAKLHPVLRRGANVLVSDDHEFWNDFPNRPREAWPALRAEKAYRDTMRDKALELYEHVQQGRPIRRFDIGADLSILVADTRMNRRSGLDRFMDEDDLEVVCDWLLDETITCPRVLVMGSPVFWPPLGFVSTDLPWWAYLAAALIPGVGPVVAASLFVASSAVDDKLISDRNLPAYRQFEQLCFALTGAPHDVLILTGDVHFGRVAMTRINKHDGADPTRVWEVISSPLGQLPGAKATSETMQSEEPYWFPADPRQFDLGGYLHDNALGPGRVRYHTRVPWKLTDADQCEQHFVTLRFWRSTTVPGVTVEVSAWLQDNVLDPEETPLLAMRKVIELDGGRLPAGADRLRRQVTHVIKKQGTHGRIVALGNPDEAWSPRTTREAIADITSERALYYVGTPDAPVWIHAVPGAGDAGFVRTNPDGAGGNNLSALPVLPQVHLWD